MSHVRGRVVPVLLAVAVLLGAAHLGAYAATGKPMLLGKSNSASKTTTLKAKNGPALKLRTKPTVPPLKVSSGAKVRKLNADLLDGLDASRLQTRTLRTTLPTRSGVSQPEWTLPAVPSGRYLVTIDVLAYRSNPSAGMTCGVNQGPTIASGYASTIPSGWAHVNATREIEVTGPLTAYCITGSGTLNTAAGIPNMIFFQPVDRATDLGPAT